MGLFADAQLRGTTVVVATHDLAMLRAFGKRVITLERGRISHDTDHDPLGARG